MAERPTAEARRTSFHHHPKPATRPHRATPAPYQPPMSPHVQQMPGYYRPHGPQLNTEAQTVSTYPRVRVRPRPSHSPCTPTAQDNEESPRPTAAASPLDSTACTQGHVHAHAQGHGPARGFWWQRCTHTQLWELQKWARAKPSLAGLVHRPRRKSAENHPLLMLHVAWEAMLADPLHPQGVDRREIPTPQDGLYVLRRLQETL